MARTGEEGEMFFVREIPYYKIIEKMPNIEVKFNLLEKVFIEELKVYGIIMQINITEIGTQYQVRYFDNSQAQTVWFFEFELLKNEKK
jgi:hypothetical protein